MTLIEAIATGFPQPRAMCAPSGMELGCSTEYPNDSATFCAAGYVFYVFMQLLKTRKTSVYMWDRRPLGLKHYRHH